LRFLELRVRGERWLAYPLGMKFPRSFRRNYPFRGRGIVAKILYALNRVGVDNVLLHRVEDGLLEGIGIEDVAYFWPSHKRSTSRFYGYKVDGGAVKEYLKFGQSDAEKRILRHEAENVANALAIPNRDFEVPQCVGMEEKPGCFVVRYEPLPDAVHDVPVTVEWFARVDRARRQIAGAGYSHGDFSWHNFKTDGQRLWILDWEEMRTGVDELIDRTSLEYGYAIYWQHKPLDLAMKGFDMNRVAAVKDLAARGISPGAMMLEFLYRNGLLNEDTSCA